MTSDLCHESRIVWLRPLAELPRYVRQAVYILARRVGINRSTYPGAVGYAELAASARSIHPGQFERRVFWLKSHDPYDGGGAPCEAVDPLTVSAGVAGVRTDRACGLVVAADSMGGAL